MGSAAGGGFPQWNCRCAVCQLAWDGDPRVRARTQSSVAVRNAGGDVVLLNASPDLRQQILATPALAPRAGALRDTPIRAVVLTNADVDHVAGLLSLRERSPLRVFGTADVLAGLNGNPVFNVLAADVVERVAIAPDAPFEPIEGVSLTLFGVPGKVPLWGEAGEVATDLEDGRTVGVAIDGGGGARAFYIPGCATMTPALAERLGGADLVLFDGTLFDDDEMIRAGLGAKTGRRMGHMPVSGPGGSLEAFAGLGVRRKVYVHLNNSNPLLVDGSAERRLAASRGWEVAKDGMEFALSPS